MTIHLNRLALLASVVAGFALLIAAPTALAIDGEYTETPCTGNEYTDVWLDDDTLDDEWLVGTQCPDGYALGTRNETFIGYPPGEFSMRTTDGEIRSVSAQVVRSADEGTGDPEPTGIKVSMQACLFSTCGPTVSSTTELVSALELSSEADQIPPGAVTVKVTTECELLVCPEQSSVKLHGLTIKRFDDTPPLLDVFEVDSIESGIRLPEASRWNNGEVLFNWEGGDPESDLLYFEEEIEHIDRCYSMFDPYFVVPDCEMIENQGSPNFSAQDLSDGYHDFSFSFANRAQLTTRRTIEIKTDATRPGQPHQFDAVPRRNGWQSSRDVRIDWTNPGETIETSTQSGIAGFSYDVDPKLGGVNPPASGEDPEKVTVDESAADSLQLRLPSAGQWTVEIQTFDRAGNFSLAGTASVNIDDANQPAPIVDAIAPINAADRLTGKTITWHPGEISPSGICGYDWAFSTAPGFNPGEDPATPLLGDDPVSLYLTPSQVLALAERPQRFHLRDYSCAGLPGDIAHEPVVVDFTAPSISISPSGGTLAAGDRVSIGAQDVKPGTIQSGIDSVICVVNSTEIPCANGAQLALGGGVNNLVVTATDNAGNSESKSAQLVADSAPPTGWIEQTDPTDPTLVRATIQDADTGVKSAEFEYRAAAGGPWMKLGNSFRSDDPSPGAITLSARIPDDGELADGSYSLRVHAEDASGAGAEIALRVGGGDASFSVPLRSAAVLSAGLRRSSKDKARPSSRLGVAYGAKPTLVGSLRRADGTPIAGAQLSIVADQSGSPPRTVASVTTAPDGSYSRKIEAGGSRRFVVRFAGGLAERSTAAEALLRVSGKLTLYKTKSFVRSNVKLRLRGRVFAAGAALPLLGKTVELRFKISGRRSGFVKRTRTDAAGRFKFDFSHSARHRPVRFTVYVVAPAEPTWAYGEGSSKQTKFVVKP